MPSQNIEQDQQIVDNIADPDPLALTLEVDNDNIIKKPISLYLIIICILFGIALSLSVFTVLTIQYKRENNDLEATQAHNYRDSLQQSLSNTEILLHAIRSTLHGAAPPSRKDFESLTLDIRRFFPGLRLVSWIPRIKVRDIPATERIAKAEGATGFRIINTDGSLPTDSQPPEDDVFPIYYRIIGIGFRDHGLSPLGINVLSAPGRRPVLDRACASGDMLATTFPTTLNRASGWGDLVLYLAVYNADLTTVYPYQACSQLVGFIAAVLRLDVLMATSFRPLPPIAADIVLFDGPTPHQAQFIGSYPAIHTQDHPPLPSLSASGIRTEWLELGGREFTLAFSPQSRSWFEYSSPLAWLMLISSLFLTLSLTIFLTKQRSATLLLTTEVYRRRQVERRLRASEYRFRLALRDSNVSVFSQDHELRYTWIYNPHIGIDAQDMIGKRHQDIFPGEFNHEVEIVKQSVIKTGISVRRELQLLIDNRRYFRDIRIEPIYDYNRIVIGIICVSIDITESKRLKEELSQALIIAERANAAKSRFLAAASHDLRQPFQAMQLYQELLSLRLTDSRQLEFCYQLGESIRSGQELLTALLDASVLNAGTITPKITTFRLQSSLSHLVAELQEQASNRGIALLLVETSAYIRSDRVLLERILRNLIVNAIKYTEDGRILVGCRRRKTGIEIQVYDTGIGIDTNNHKLIFQDFYQVSNSERRQSQGLGLGLGIVYRTAHLLGHPMAMRSVLGRGSMFSVKVPIVENSNLESQSILDVSLLDSLRSKIITPQHILIIEDDETQRYPIRLLLESAGHTVMDAASLDQALEQIAATTVLPTLIISDLQLPGSLDGMAVITNLRRQLRLPVPALLITGDTDRERLHQAAASGLTVLHKPFTHAILLEALSMLLAPGSHPESPVPR